MTNQAQLAALVAFDWFRPVDPDDVFANQVDNLIEQLEALSPCCSNSEDVKRLIDVLEHAVPSYRSATVKRLSCDECSSSSSSILQVITEELDRKVSIVKTPLEYYCGQRFRFDEGGISSSSSLSEETQMFVKPPALGSKQKKWRWSTKPRK